MQIVWVLAGIFIGLIIVMQAGVEGLSKALVMAACVVAGVVGHHIFSKKKKN